MVSDEVLGIYIKIRYTNTCWHDARNFNHYGTVSEVRLYLSNHPLIEGYWLVPRTPPSSDITEGQLWIVKILRDMHVNGVRRDDIERIAKRNYIPRELWNLTIFEGERRESYITSSLW